MMKAVNEEQRRSLLAVGTVLATAGAIGIVFPLLYGVPDAIGPLAFPVGFVVGLAGGLGTTLTLLNLRRV